MLERLESVPWADLEHAYGPASDVPALLRALLSRDPAARASAQRKLYGNVFHQGTRYPATPHVVPFLIEMCASAKVPDRGWILRFWGSLITGYLSVRERPCWADGKRFYWYGQLQEDQPDDPFVNALHAIYRESLKGHELVCKLLGDDMNVRVGAAWVLACLPTKARASVPKLREQLQIDEAGWSRAAIAFALGELGATATVRRILARDNFPAARCMAACQLARLEPSEALVEPLLQFVAEPIEGYENLPGAGGKSTGDAAYSISRLPVEVQRTAVPAICDRLDRARSFDTIPLVTALLSAAFERTDKPLARPTALQKRVLARMTNTSELWSIGNLTEWFTAYGLPHDRKACAKLAGVKVRDDKALAELRSALSYADMGFLPEARREIEKALELDPKVFERSAAPDEAWLLCAKAFAETDPERAVAAFRSACAVNPEVARRVNPSWRLADVLDARGLV